MQVRNLVPWSGHDFNYIPDEIVDLPDEMAKDREAAGLVAFLSPAAAKKAAAEPKAEAFPAADAPAK